MLSNYTDAKVKKEYKNKNIFVLHISGLTYFCKSLRISLSILCINIRMKRVFFSLLCAWSLVCNSDIRNLRYIMGWKLFVHFLYLLFPKKINPFFRLLNIKGKSIIWWSNLFQNGFQPIVDMYYANKKQLIYAW